jgi:hypothetical protein
MNAKTSLRFLQIVLGAVLFLYSVQLVIGQLHGGRHRHAGFLFLILGVVEAAAALIFLLRASIGGPLLIGVFAVAAALHLLHGQIEPIGSLRIYTAAVTAVLSGEHG